jgi:hypothetical protein
MHLMEKVDINLVVGKKVKNELNILLVDLLLLDVKRKVKVKLGAKQNDKINKHIKRNIIRK